MDRARNNHAGQNEGDGAGGGGVRWIVYATSSRKIMRGMGQQGVGYAGEGAEQGHATKLGGCL